MTDDANEISEWVREYTAKREARCKERFEKLKNDIIPVLRRFNVEMVVMHYDGYGDSTDESTIACLGPRGGWRPCPDEVNENELIDIMFEVVPDGYENNEGGYGDVTLNVKNGTLRNEHSQRYVDVTNSEKEYTL